MKNNIITELVMLELLATTTEEQLLAKAEVINDFLKKQDGYIDGELVKHVAENTWYFIYHFESMEKLQAIGEAMRRNKIFAEITPLIVPEKMKVTFFNQMQSW